MKQLYIFVFGIQGEAKPRIKFHVVASNPLEAVKIAFERDDVQELPAEGTHMEMDCLSARWITP